MYYYKLIYASHKENVALNFNHRLEIPSNGI